MIYTSIYADSAGESHFKDVNVELSQADFAPPAPTLYISSFNSALRYAFCTFPAGWRGDWHPTPQRLFFFIMSGEVAGQVSDGEVRQFGAGGIVLAEDTTGKGHVSWIIGESDMLAAVVQLPE